MIDKINNYFNQIPISKRKKWFKNACIAEGITCVLLYLVGMPIKYEFGIWWHMIPIGCLHGAMFTWYLLLAPFVKKAYKWDDEDFIFIILAAFFPLATFWVEKKLI